jgi:hypothetical protein
MIHSSVKRQGNNLLRPFALSKPCASINDAFRLREKRMVNGYRKMFVSNHEIVVPHVALREEVEVHLVPDTKKDALQVRTRWDSRMVQSVVYTLRECPDVHF